MEELREKIKEILGTNFTDDVILDEIMEVIEYDSIIPENGYVLLDYNDNVIKDPISQQFTIYQRVEGALVEANKVVNFTKAVKCKVIVETGKELDKKG